MLSIGIITTWFEKLILFSWGHAYFVFSNRRVMNKIVSKFLFPGIPAGLILTF